MKKVQFGIGIIFLLIAVAIFIWGSGLRVIYSSALFILLGILSLVRAFRKAEEKPVDKHSI